MTYNRVLRISCKIDAQNERDLAMKPLYIIKTGTTFENTARELGDFDIWTKAAMGVDEEHLPILVSDVENGESPPDPSQCAGAVITGSHAMVTDDLPWSLNLEIWVRECLDKEIPILGVCYGHQLLARAAGGTVGFHPGGKEIGTVKVNVKTAGRDDLLFRYIETSFNAHVTHAQTVLTLPENAVCLAYNEFEPHQAFRIGSYAWGVQFHPEYTPRIMKAYIIEQADELRTAGKNTDHLLAGVRHTPEATRVLKRFCERITTGA